MLEQEHNQGATRHGLVAEIGKYLTASVIGTLAHYCLMLILLYLVGVEEVVASTCGAVLGAVIIYILNYYVTFRSTRTHQVAAARFAVVALVSVLLNAGILKGLIVLLDWHVMLLQAATTLTVFGLTYLLNRSWTF